MTDTIEKRTKPPYSGLRARLGPTIMIILYLVHDLPRTPLGKLRFVISRVAPAQKLGHD